MNWIRSKSIVFRIIGVVTVIALFGLVGVTTRAPAGSAQQSQSGEVPEFSTYTLFTNPDTADMKPDVLQQLADAIRKAQPPGNCALGRLKLRVAKGGNPSFEEALGQARRDAVLSALNSLGVPVAGRLFVEEWISGGNEGADTRYEPARDQTAPKLDVTWTPPKGSKVRTGTRITAKVIASDDTNRWQTGLKNIKLIVEGGDRPFGFEEYPQNCEHPSPPRTLERFYIVPSPAPPMVRLRATAKDYAGNETEVWADFPTELPCASGVRWVGTMHAIHQPGGEHRVTTDIKVQLCENALPSQSPPVKGMTAIIILEDNGSIVTRKHWTDTNWTDNPCIYSGQGTSSALSPGGHISRTLEDIGPRGELRWSTPTYEVNLAPTNSPDYTEVCHDAYGTHTRKEEGGSGSWSVNSGPGKEIPLQDGRMVGSYRDGPVDIVSWSICRQGVDCSPPF